MDITGQASIDSALSPHESVSFARFGGFCAILAGATGFLYSVAFVLVARANPALGEQLAALFLLLGGLLGSAALVAVYERVRRHGAQAGFALWALLLGLVSALGTAIHGGYDLANVINPPATRVDLPSAIDPRGLLTFGVAGLATLTFAWLIRQGAGLPRGLGGLGFVLGVLLVIVYLGRLIVLDADSPAIVLPAVLAGFAVNPAWYIWLGRSLLT